MREKLIELLDDFSTPIMLLDTKLMDWNIPTQQLREAFADYLIANDVVPVVRCRDCKHYDNSEGIFWCHLNSKFYKGGMDWHSFPEDGFCCYGERKNNA